MEDLVSVITPVTGDGTRLADAIRSVRGQTYSNVEHVVVTWQGGPGVNALRAALRGLDGVRFVDASAAHSGVNDGLREARGRVVSVLSGDDGYPPWAIEVAVRTLGDRQDIDGVYGDALGVDPASGRQLLMFVPRLHGSPAGALRLVSSATFVRQRVYLQRGGLNDRQAYLDDIGSWLLRPPGLAMERVDEVLAVQRLDPAALSRSLARRTLGNDADAVADRSKGHRLPRAIRVLGDMTRAALERRRLWLRFMSGRRRAASGGTGSPWSRFLAQSNPTFRHRRIALLFIPRLGSRFAWDAVCVDRNMLKEWGLQSMVGGD